MGGPSKPRLSIGLEIRRGDITDPLAGVVRLATTGESDIDVVVGRFQWQVDMLERAMPVEIAGIRLPVATAADLILLKLYAGGSRDHRDIEQLSEREDRDAIVESVNSRIGRLPPDNQTMGVRLSAR